MIAAVRAYFVRNSGYFWTGAVLGATHTIATYRHSLFRYDTLIALLVFAVIAGLAATGFGELHDRYQAWRQRGRLRRQLQSQDPSHPSQPPSTSP